MTGHLAFVAAFLVLVLRDGFGAPVLVERLGPWGAAGATLGAMALFGALVWMRMVWLCRAIDRRGSVRALRKASRLAGAAPTLGAGVFCVGVLVFGWLDAVRWWVGDGVGYDEAIALAPMLVLSLCLSASVWGLERRSREATLWRALGEGQPVYAIPSRWGYTWSAARHGALFVLIPAMTIFAWSEAVAWWFDVRDDALLTGEGNAAFWWAAAVQGGGALLVVCATPWLARVLWDTTPLRDGPLHDRLARTAARRRVRIREYLVWHTGGAHANGAVVGVVPWLRYVLLTDALLDALPEDELEAVVAHEIGHVASRHIPWMLASVLGLALTVSAVGVWVGDVVALGAWVSAAAWIAGGVGAIALFGVISRRFERQADVFAAGALGGGDERGQERIATDGVQAMGGALARVTALSGMDADRFTWRHGSIRSRQRSLDAQIGAPIGRTRADRDARRAKGMIALALAVGLGLTVWTEAGGFPGEAEEAGRGASVGTLD